MPETKPAVTLGSIWRHKNGRWPGLRYRVIDLGTGDGFVCLERVSIWPHRRSWEHEGWVRNKLVQVSVEEQQAELRAQGAQ